jgi:PKD repeat protein
MYTGNAAEWDGTYRFRASVVIIDSQYHAWYSGANGASWGCVPGYAHGIGHAVSNDGLNWTIDADNPIFHVNDNVSWRECRTYTPSVIYDANMFSGHGDTYSYKMWFTGRTNTPATNYSVGYAGYLPVTTYPPVACFAHDPHSGFGPLTVNFDASCSGDLDGTIVKYLWEISDGTTAIGKTFSKTFTEKGVYIIQLTVIDNDGLRDSVTNTVTVKVVYPPADIKLTRIVDRSFFRANAYHKIEWGYNPHNSDVVVIGYNLYRKLASEDESQFKLLASLEDGVYKYNDLKLPINIRYSYRVTALAKCDRDSVFEECGRESGSSSTVEN